jgi:hypothetical protein
MDFKQLKSILNSEAVDAGQPPSITPSDSKPYYGKENL